MTIKTLKARFQISECDGSPGQALVTILANGTEVFAGYLGETVDIFPPQVYWTSTPYAEAVFDLDIPDWQPDEPVSDTVSIPMQFSCAGGTIVLQGMYSNYCANFERDPNDPTKYIGTPGNANTFDLYNIVSQPLVNGQPELTRYNILCNLNITGPGCLPIFRGEIVTFDAAIQKFNDTIPVGYVKMV